MKEKSLFSKIMGIIFIVWFVCSIIAMLYLSKINTYYTIMIFGQYFFVFGFIPLKHAEGLDKLIGAPFILVGLGAMVIPYLIMNPVLLPFNIIWESLLAVLLFFLFILAGFALLLIPIINNNKLKKVCTLTVNANIIRYNKILSDKGRRLYCPVYYFEFNNQKYEVTNNKYSNFGNEPVETMVNLKINPNNPYQFMDNRKVGKLLTYIGIIVLVIFIPLFIFMINTIQFIEQ